MAEEFEKLEAKIVVDDSDVDKKVKRIKSGFSSIRQEAGKGIGFGKHARQASKEIDLLSKQLAANKQKMETYRRDAERLRAEIANPPAPDLTREQKSLEAYEKEMDALVAKLEPLRKNLQEFQTWKTGAGNEGGALDAQINDAQAEYDALVRKIDQVGEAYSAMEDKIAAKQETANAAEAQRRKLTDLESQIARTELSSEKLESRISKLNGEMNQNAQSSGKMEQNLGKVSKAATKTKRGLSGIGPLAGGVFGKALKPLTQYSRAINMAIKRIFVLGVAYKVIRGAVKYLMEGLNANKQFAASLNAIKVNLATAFQPIFKAVLPAINALMSAFATLTGYIAAFISMLFGSSYAASKDAAKGYGAVADAAGGAGKAVKDAADEAEGSLASFDKFNDITPQKKTDADSSGGGGGASGLNFDDVPEPKNLQLIKDLIEKLKELFKPTAEAAGRLWEQLKRIGGFAFEGLKDFYETFLKPVGTWVLGEGLPRFIDILATGLSKINFGKINDSLHGLWEAITPFAINVGEGLLWFYENVIMPICVWTYNEVLPVFLDTLSEAFNALNSAWEVLKPGVAALFEKFLKPVAIWTGGKIIDILNLLKDTFHTVSEWFKTDGSTVMGALQSIADLLGFIWTYMIEPQLNLIWALFKGVFSSVVDIILGAVTYISGIITSLINIFKSLIDFVKNVFTGNWSGAWENIKDIFLNVFGMISSGAKFAINTVIDIINGFIRGLNNFKVPDFIPGIGGMGVNIPLIPKLAKGGLAYGETLAIVGDNPHARSNPEVIAPLDQLQAIITTALLQKDITTGGNAQKMEIRLAVEDMMDLVYMLVDPMNKTAKNLGYGAVFKPVSMA